MKSEKNLSVSEFKQHCLQLLDAQKLRKQSLAITRRGKVVAIVSSPISVTSTPLKGSIQFLKSNWETAQFSDEWQLS